MAASRRAGLLRSSRLGDRETRVGAQSAHMASELNMGTEPTEGDSFARAKNGARDAKKLAVFTYKEKRAT